MRLVRLFSVVALLVLLLVNVTAPTASAQTSGSSGTAVATGLNNPRGIWVNDDDSFFVAESGNGGSDVIQPPAGSPTGTEAVMRGYSGQITKVGADGTKTVVAGNLPSAGTAVDGYVGPESLIYANGYLWAVTGAEASVTPRLKYDGSVLRIDPMSGDIKVIADITANELANNPQANVPHPADSDPYGITLGADNKLYVADAAGNDLYQVDPSTGAYKIVTHFAGLPTNKPNPERGGKMENDPVPTSIVGSTNGKIYVGLLGGGAPIHGTTKVVSYNTDGSVSDVATGLTYVTGVTIGPDQNLYIVEMTNGLDLTATPPHLTAGDVLRIMPDGTKTVVAANLNMPSGIDFDRAGNMFVTINSGTNNSDGQVLRYNNVATPVTSPTPLPGTGPTPGTKLFPQTGYSLSGDFLNFWIINGGLPVFGYPINSAQPVNGVITQWLERERMELHPENAAPYNVELGLLGEEALANKGVNWQTLPKVSVAPAGCMLFKETGHSLCGDFLNYWQSHGLDLQGANSLQQSLALFGYPISEPKVETNSSGQTVVTQWFERARFEYYPDNPAGYKVELGLLGDEVFKYVPQQ